LIETSVRVAGQSLLSQNTNKNLTKGNNVNRRKDNIKCYKCKRWDTIRMNVKSKRTQKKFKEIRRPKGRKSKVMKGNRGS